MKNKVNRPDFIARAAAKAGMTKVDMEKALNAFIDSVGEILTEGDSLALVGFGSFETKLLKGKTGKIPNTDRNYTTQDKLVPKFSAGKKLKDLVAAAK